MKKTKIIATLGPSSSDRETMVNMIKNGVDVFRINFSHADYDLVKKQIEIIRSINKELKTNVAILGDLQGPKLRIGVVKEGVVLQQGQVLEFTNEPIEGDEYKVYMTYERFAKDVKIGERILVDDGKLVFEVVETNEEDIVKARVIQGGELHSKKGVNLPNTYISLPALTPKDIEDTKFILDQKLDWIALSFVRHSQDLRDLRDFIRDYTKGEQNTPIIAKIEKPEGVENIQEILQECDAIMVARGDLGVEVPMEEVPAIQKRLVEQARFYAKPVIIATQMMETMIHSLTPTRAEVNDVANSVLDGADAVMLSGETSVGRYPAEVIANMSKIVFNIERDVLYLKNNAPIERTEFLEDRYITDMICYSAVRIAKKAKAKAIITLTHTGYTAFQISAHRPNAHIVVYCSNKNILPRLNLIWGVRAFYYDTQKSTDETVVQVNALTLQNGFVDKGDYVVNLNAMPVYESGKTNTLRLSTI